MQNGLQCIGVGTATIAASVVNISDATLNFSADMLARTHEMSVTPSYGGLRIGFGTLAPTTGIGVLVEQDKTQPIGGGPNLISGVKFIRDGSTSCLVYVALFG